MTHSEMNDSITLIEKYFQLNRKQKEDFKTLEELFLYWNDKINLISRKDVGYLFERHILHSLGIAKIVQFNPGADILDVGTGGGFPGIPLAILFPDTQFLLIDSIGKKIKVVKEISNGLSVNNINAQQIRAEKVKGKFDFVVSRAVTRMKPFYNWIKGNIKDTSTHSIYNGVLYLKGGDLEEEMKELKLPYQIYDLSDYFEEPFFETKKVVYVPA